MAGYIRADRLQITISSFHHPSDVISIPEEVPVFLDLPNEIAGYSFCLLDAVELAKTATVSRAWNQFISSDWMSYNLSLQLWLKEITEKTWKEKIDCQKYGLDFTGAPRIDRRASTRDLWPLSERVEKKMGITNMIRPERLTLRIVLQIAKDYSVPISPYWFNQIITKFGDIPAEQTCVLFFTNSILTGTRMHTPDQHAFDVTTIGKECGVAIRMHQVRDFMAFLVLTYLNSPEEARTLLYSSETYTRLLEKVDNRSLYGGFAPSGLGARHDGFDEAGIGVGASGNSQAIGTGNIGL